MGVYFKTLNLGLFLSDVYLNHLMTIILSVFLRGYRGKTVDFQEVSHCHRTTTAYFLNHGKWDDFALQNTLKSSILQIIYKEAQNSGQPIGIRQKASAFALHLRKTEPGVSLVTVGGREFYVYRYEGELNDIPNAAVILSYPKDGFGNPKALRVFLSTNAGLSTAALCH